MDQAGHYAQICVENLIRGQDRRVPVTLCGNRCVWDRHDWIECAAQKLLREDDDTPTVMLDSDTATLEELAYRLRANILSQTRGAA